MLSTFGKAAAEYRDQLGLTEAEFAALVGMSVEEVAALESLGGDCTPEIVESYVKVLGLEPGSAPAQALAEAAEESNKRRADMRRFMGDDQLMALLARHGNDLSDEVKARINRIIAEEIAAKARGPKYRPPAPVAKTPAGAAAPAAAETRQHPRMSPVRLAELVLLSEELRGRYVKEEEPLSATAFLDADCEADPRLRVELCQDMPLFAPDVCAVTAGGGNGHTLFIDSRFHDACAGGGRIAGNHILLHEYAHHRLHGDQLAASEAGFLPPHALSGRGNDEAREAVTTGGYESPDSLDLEADFFATLLTVPWTRLAEVAVEDYKARFLVRKLARDYGAFWPVMDRLVRYLRMDVARDRIREALYRQNRIDHPFLLLH